MKRFSSIILGLLICALPYLAIANESTPLSFARTSITIIRSQPAPVESLPWQPQVTANPEVTFNVELRDAATYYLQQGWFNLSSPEENGGVLLAFGEPKVAPVVASNQYKPLDVLLIDLEGKILQIVPDIMLSELQHDIMPPSPILAFLFLKGGLCEKLSIRPGDIVEHSLFKKPPTVLGIPAAAPPAPEKTEQSPAE